MLNGWVGIGCDVKKEKKKGGGEFRHTVNAETQNRKFS